MISREKCLEWAKEVGGVSDDETIVMWHRELEALINRAYREGKRDMRERAADVLDANCDSCDPLGLAWDILDSNAKAIRKLEIE